MASNLAGIARRFLRNLGVTILVGAGALVAIQLAVPAFGLRPFSTPYWHRTFETWFTLLRRTGFTVEALTEPRPSDRAMKGNPLLAGSSRVPFFLVMDCRPTGAKS